jgi:hypothetical protein
LRWCELATVSLLGCAVGLAGCRAREQVVATLERSSGQVQRDGHASVGTWVPAANGVTFVIGDGVRTGDQATADLRLFGKSQLSLEPKTMLRFLARPSDPKHARLELEMGQVIVSTDDEGLELETEFGAAQIDAHGRVRLVREAAGTRLEVLIGSAEIVREPERLKLSAGDTVQGRAGQPLQALKNAPSSAPAASAPPIASAAAAAAERDGAPEDGGAVPGLAFARGPALVDLVIGAGEAIVVHDPRPPTAIGVATGGRCPERAIVAVDPGRPRAKETLGDTTVGIELGPGSHRYVLHCLDASGVKGPKVAEGSVSVIADAGSRQIAKTAPLTSLDADGRNYTVLYQSLLPKIAMRWPSAPAAPSYSLSLSSPNGTKALTLKSASTAFASGALSEGEHRFAFEGGGARSRTTSVTIRFDNAAPTATIASPADGSFVAGSSVTVSGTALPGWSVSVAGTTLNQDAQSRFSEQVTAPAGLRALAVRFTQPQRGVHYYLRRGAR